MKKLISTQYSAGAINGGMLLIRLVFGTLIMGHGYQKLVNFAEMKSDFMNFLGMGSNVTLLMVIFAEFFCGLFITIGLFSRLASIPLIINMAVIVFKVHDMDFFDKGEKGTMFLAAFLLILFVGPGKVSVDGITGK